MTDTMTPAFSCKHSNDNIIQSPGDNAQYRALTLDNGLQILLVHDPDAERASASMNVATGSAFNPERFPGLAHFLEHMLFLGTDRYPDPNDYQQFLGEHGGHHNAFTGPRDTNYHFDIDPAAFEGALDRFSRFFIAPALDADYVERERHAVNAEYQARLRDDGRRLEDALSQALNPKHPYNRFSVGNLETLKDYPDQRLREALVEFHQRYYDANTMTLALLGPQSLDTLATLAHQHFAEVPNRNLAKAEVDQPITHQLPHAIAVQSLQRQHQVRFYFPIPDPDIDYRLKPVSFISHLIGHEGEGSLLSHLRALGWADGLSAGSSRSDGHRALFTINIELTPTGRDHLEDIQASLMAWIALIDQHGVDTWRYDEEARLNDQQFRFPQRQSPSQQAIALSMAMSRYPIAEVRRAAWLMEGFDATRIQAYLECLTSDNMLRLYSGPEVESDQRSPWFHTPWHATSLKSHQTGRIIDGLVLPAPNDFIARDLTLIESLPDATECLIDMPGLDFWHHPTSRFDAPRVEWRFSLQSPSASNSVQASVLNELLARWLDDSLSDALYPARIAGQGMSAHAHARGMTLSFSGWRDRQSLVIRQVLEQLMQGDITDDQLARVKRTLQRKWQDEPASALHEQLQRALMQSLITPAWRSTERLAALEDISGDDLRRFRTQWLKRLHVQALAVGNIGSDDARREAERLQALLTPQITLHEISDLDVLHATDTPPLLRPPSDRQDAGVLRYLPAAGRTPDDQAQLAILGQLIGAPFFNQLRTEKQLGYIVMARYQPLLEAPGLGLLVQSPDYDTAALLMHIDQFLSGFDITIETLEEKAFLPYRQAVHDRLLEREQRLNQLTGRLWQELAHGWTRFDRREQLAARVAQQSVDDVRRAWQALRQRPMLDVGADADQPANTDSMPWQSFLERSRHTRH